MVSPQVPELDAPRGAQTLARGLAILRLLVEDGGPITATAIAARTGTHQSSASRLLRALMDVGYVRKVRGRGFAVDVGVFELAANATRAFALSDATQEVMLELGRRSPGLIITLGALWNDTLVHLERVVPDHEPIPFSVSALPLHLSTHAILLLQDEPEDQAILTLKHSRERFGWNRPTDIVPETEIGILKAGRERTHDGVLILDSWHAPRRRAGSIRVTAPWGPAGLAYAGTEDTVTREEIDALLRQGAVNIEATLA